MSKEIEGSIFVDAGPCHIINQLNSEVYEPIQISNMELNENKIKVTCSTGHDFQTNDIITFTNLQGDNMENISNKNFQINVLSRYCFEFDFDNLGTFINGTVNYVNKSIEMNHITLEEKLKEENHFISFGNNTIQPVVSIMGSIVASEAIKLITGKYLPINQWFTWSEPQLTYNQVINIQEKLKKSSWLIVGSGAIGCELLKNLAYLNIGSIIITDPDTIEKSNLSRQFLFRENHIGKLKSEIAAEIIKSMKLELDITFLSEKVGNDNKLFTDVLLGSKKLTGVFNALDNIGARKFMDEQCFNYELPLFESGTLGTKGNTQSVIPFLTETYSASNDPPIEKSFAVCTIKNFPNEIYHTIHWALDQFEFYNKTASNLQKLLDAQELTVEERNEIDTFIKTYNIKTFPLWALKMFKENYYNQIVKLLENFPPDTLTSEGNLFWSAGKRCPVPITFDIQNQLHFDYIKVSTILLCNSLSVNYNFTDDELIDIINKNEETKEENQIKYKPNPQVLDKDNDNNYHIKWLNIASNLRAINYGIPPVDFQYTKGIAGKIIPAVATTTSMIAGLITIEMLKYMVYQDNLKIENFKSTFVNLVDLTIVGAEPIEAPTIEIAGQKFNSWFKFIQKEDILLFDFKSKYEELFKTTISMITIDSTIIYAEFLNNENKLLTEIIKLNDESIDLTKQSVIFTLGSDGDEDLPNIVFSYTN
jgi:ubiquitin-activating enzyme E1